MRARRSASLSQSLTASITSWRGGIPAGKRARRSASRSTGCAPPLGAAAVERPRLLLVVVLRLLEALALVRVLVAFLEVPATPWVILRCAPSEAARVNVFPHSGQVSASAAGVAFALVVRVAIGFLPFADGDSTASNIR